MNKREEILAQQNHLRDQAEQEASKQRNKLSDFSQIIMAINNIEHMCQEYGIDDGHGKKKSTLRCNVNMDGFASKPKHFDLDAHRVDFAMASGVTEVLPWFL